MFRLLCPSVDIVVLSFCLDHLPLGNEGMRNETHLHNMSPPPIPYMYFLPVCCHQFSPVSDLALCMYLPHFFLPPVLTSSACCPCDILFIICIYQFFGFLFLTTAGFSLLVLSPCSDCIYKWMHSSGDMLDDICALTANTVSYTQLIMHCLLLHLTGLCHRGARGRSREREAK